jgi:predicted DCC family thiol-disulfide oxidoreductase YuxK
MSQPVLVYDGHCRFCINQANRLAAWTGGRLKLESFHDPGILQRYGLTKEECEKAVQLVDELGRIYPGAEAAAQALNLNPKLAWLRAFYYVPGLRQLADAVYAWVSKNRFRLSGSCTDGACAHH